MAVQRGQLVLGELLCWRGRGEPTTKFDVFSNARRGAVLCPDAHGLVWVLALLKDRLDDFIYPC